MTTPAPSLPPAWQGILRKLQACKSKQECLEQTYRFLTARYHGGRLTTFLRLYELFEKDLNKIAQKRGFLHCSTHNYLLRSLLVHSGHFCNQDIANKWTLVYYLSPHQYVRIKLAKHTFVNVDLWAARYGLPLGTFAYGFTIGIFKKPSL